MERLTPNRLRVLGFIEEFIGWNGYSPTLDEIARSLDISKPTVQQYLTALEQKGYIKRARYAHRSIEVVGRERSGGRTELPLLGVIAAGQPIEAVEDREMMDVAGLLGVSGGRELFLLRVKGDSMIDEGIFDGDYVVVERREAASNGETVVALLPEAARILGLAVDVGTTKLAAYLLDLESGDVLAVRGAMNPQISYGEDVISRIAYSNENEDGRETLQGRVVVTLNEMIAEMCGEADVSSEQIVEAVIVGNTAMHHLLAGLPVRQLAMAPYVPAVGEALDLLAGDIALDISPGAFIHLPPNIAGFIGGDHVSMVLSTDVWQTENTVIALDIGTNTEITLTVGGRMLSCSCASGPAFEGAHIRDGMRAAPGAIERVQIKNGQSNIYTIGEKPPVGICGSGILDAVAELLKDGIIDHRGAFQGGAANVREGISTQYKEFLLVPSEDTGHGKDIVVTRSDINEIQLAKGAIRAGLEILLEEGGIAAGDIDEFIIAGAFGTYLDVGSAMTVGMFPELPRERFRQVGNAAGTGAQQMLLSAERRRVADEIPERVEYIELTTHAGFEKAFMKAMFFDP